MSIEMDTDRTTSGRVATGGGELTSRAGILTLGGFLAYSVYLVVPMLLARLLSREEYGGYGQALVVLNIAYGIALWGLPASITFLFPVLATERRAAFLAGTSALFLAAGAIAAAAVLFFAYPIACGAGNADLAPLLRFAAIYLGFLVASDFLGPVLVVTDRAFAAAVAQVAEALGRVAAVLLPVALGFGVPGIFVALAALLGLRLLIALIVVRAGFGGCGPDRRLIRRQIGYAAPLGGAAAFSTIAQAGIGLVAIFTFTPALFAVYAIGMFRIPLATLLKRAAKPVLREEFSRLTARGDVASILATYREATRKTALLVFPLAFFTTFHAETVVVGLFSERYLESVPIFRLAGLVTFIGAFYFAIVAEGMGRGGLPLRLSLVHLLTGLPLALVLTPTVGLLGPVLAEIAGTWASGVYAVSRTRRLLGVRHRDVLPYAELARISVAAAAAAASLLPLRLAGLPPIVGLAVLGAAFAMLYALVLFAPGGLLTAADRAWLRTVRNRIPILAGGAR